MLEIRFHGRGGQGALTAARILASAFWKEKKYALVLPEFKSERRSAPIAVGLRVDQNPIILRSKIYTPDYLVILDPSLLQLKQAKVLDGFKNEQGLIVVNATRESKYLELLAGYKLGIADVDSISGKYGLGPRALPATGTAILGAFAKVTGLLSLESILQACQDSDELPKKEENIKAIKEVFELSEIIEVPFSERLLKDEAKPSEFVFQGWQELPQSVISLGDTTGNLTGSWRRVKPYYEQKLAPCKNACLAGSDIPGWLKLLSQKKYQEAWEVLVERNPLPAVTARVCPHPCENSCNRGQFDEFLAINALERFLGEEALTKRWHERWTIEKSSITQGGRIAIIGAGPAGLSCAYQLGRRGYYVRIYEALPEIGGMLIAGIPEFRLSKDLLIREIIRNILPAGINIETNYRVDKSRFEELQQNFDAVFVATGAHRSKTLGIPGEDLAGVMSGLDFLKKINLGKSVKLGERVAVIGGGNTAIDAARVAKRLGAQVYLVYRRTKEDMPAFKEEITAAEKEGIKFYFLLKPLAIIPDENGKIKSLDCLNGKVKGKDKDGRSQVSFSKVSMTSFAIDNIITAIGEEPDLSFFPENLPEKVFVGGDAKDMAGTVAAAIKSGREVAESIDHYLKTGKREEIKTESELKIVQFEDLNLAYFRHQKRKLVPALEAKRCFSCGVCDLCGNCWKFCPHMSIFEKSKELKINYDYCKGCGVCVQECPRSVISKELEV